MPRAIGGWVACVLVLLSLTPFGRYVLRAAFEEGRILRLRRPITAMVGNERLDAATRAKLRIVLDARAYADSALGLDAGESFTMFSPLPHDTLVLVLSAAYRDQLRFYRWWFPVVGRVPYKGYFNFGEAQKAEARFQADGFDTRLRPASAFSTLGWFNDPLVSTTLRGDSLTLANTVIHELTHNTFFPSGQAEFNESFASFVGARGSGEFFRKRGAMKAAGEADARWSDDRIMAAFWRRLHDDIDSVFKAHPGDSARHERLVLRDSVYREAKSRLVFRIAPMLRTISPSGLERVRLDNAAVLSARIYSTDLDLFDSVYAREGRDTRRAVARVIEIAKGDSKRPFEALRTWVARK